MTQAAQADSRGAQRKPKSTPAAKRQGLFPSEAEIARRLSQTPEEWAGKAILLERHGLPRVDPVMGGRFWPAVTAFWERRYNLTTRQPGQPDGEEDYGAL